LTFNAPAVLVRGVIPENKEALVAMPVLVEYPLSLVTLVAVSFVTHTFPEESIPTS
jgi:hypothetical protein